MSEQPCSSADPPPWFTGAVWASALVGALALVARLATLRHGHWISKDDVIGADFATFWAAGRLALSGHAVAAFGVHAFDVAQKAMLGPGRCFAFWSYPPPSLFLYLPFAPLPYFPAFVAWMGTSFAALAVVARRLLGSWRETLLLLLCPAAVFDVLVGQNGILIAAVLLFGLMLIERRPWLGGALLGLLVLKPQMALLLPVAVIAGRHWRVMGGALVSGGLLLAASVAAFGVVPWRDFFAHTLPAQAQMLRHGEGWFQNAMPTAFMAARLMGLDWRAAAVAHVPFLLLGAGLVWRAWRSGAALEAKAVALVTATAAASPQLFNYDLVALSAALLLWVRRDPRPATCASALAGWALPALCIVFSGFGCAWLSPLVLAAVAWRAGSSAVNPLGSTHRAFPLAAEASLASSG